MRKLIISVTKTKRDNKNNTNHSNVDNQLCVVVGFLIQFGTWGIIWWQDICCALLSNVPVLNVRIHT